MVIHNGGAYMSFRVGFLSFWFEGGMEFFGTESDVSLLAIAQTMNYIRVELMTTIPCMSSHRTLATPIDMPQPTILLLLLST